MEFHGPRTQIFREAKATNETVVVYTVPIGKKLLLIESILVTDAGANGSAEVEIRDGDDIHLRHLNFIDVRDRTKGIVGADHCEPGWPIELTAGWDIAVTSSIGSLEAECDIFGYEVDA